MIHISHYNRTRYWAVYLDGELLAVTVYKKGAVAVAQALARHGYRLESWKTSARGDGSVMPSKFHQIPSMKNPWSARDSERLAWKALDLAVDAVMSLHWIRDLLAVEIFAET